MAVLTPSMISIIANHAIGFVATVNDDGTPNLSPKGTMVTLDEAHIVFGEIRSPGTLHNLRMRPTVEINFLDILARKGVRVRGQAGIVENGTSDFNTLRPLFDKWGNLANSIRCFVRINVETAQMITSPAYDIGATEEGLRAHWKEYYGSK